MGNQREALFAERLRDPGTATLFAAFGAGVAEATAQHVLGDGVGRRQPDHAAASRL
jgi:hypothetical protein